MTLPDADHPRSTPVVHLTRRAALAAERAALAAERAEQAAATKPRTRAPRPAPERTPTATTPVVTAQARTTPVVTTPAAAHADTRIRRVPRRAVAVASKTAANPATPVARRRGRGARASRLTLTSAAAALAMFGAAAMPAHASTGTSAAIATLAPAVSTQDFAVTQVALPSTSRDGFTVGGGVASTGAGAVAAGETVTYGGDVRSPFPGPVRMSSGFGYRAAPCGACSSLHQGLDFNPGMGAPIGAVAAGTVRVSGIYFSYGETVIIDHEVDGRKVSTLYGHMIPGSSPLKVGDRVEPGQFIGSVGSSGVSTGAHLHLEVLMDGTLPIDPAAWLAAHTGRAL
ncbi:M23 family metallopeptidase [Curtobacterium sp. MCLR17_032]|uniref:M23 family metallopeptidase n=1 Tax=Curtobacterium sp. MCLR17_032 TaxID=2175650 RepID=UPI000DB647CA|nr:M23 family metallopeptidase [Curtobacterium sp. MCLR17_032]WIE61376.1 M23 family metallopeptidase [Curtobacterium sp. MCLR17_032]